MGFYLFIYLFIYLLLLSFFFWGGGGQYLSRGLFSPTELFGFWPHSVIPVTLNPEYPRPRLGNNSSELITITLIIYRGPFLGYDTQGMSGSY